MSVGRHRNRRLVPTVVGITGLALGRTIAPIGLAAVRTAVVAPVPAVVAGSDLTLARTARNDSGTVVTGVYAAVS